MHTPYLVHEATSLRVDPARGRVFRANGKPASHLTADGYSVVMVRSAGGESGRVYPSARVIYEAVNGPLPEGQKVYRVNDRTADNRIGNLYAAEVSA